MNLRLKSVSDRKRGSATLALNSTELLLGISAFVVVLGILVALQASAS